MPNTSKRSNVQSKQLGSTVGGNKTATIKDKKSIQLIEPKQGKKPQSKQQQSQAVIKEEEPSFRQKDSKTAMSQGNIGNLMDQQSLRSVTEISKRSLNENSEREDDYVDQKTGSRATSNRNGGDDKIWTEQEILNDEDLWRVSDSSEYETEEEEEKKEPVVVKNSAASDSKNPDEAAGDENNLPNSAAGAKKTGTANDSAMSSPVKAKVTPYNPYDRNKDYYEDSEQLEDELEQMARYLVDKAPQQD